MNHPALLLHLLLLLPLGLPLATVAAQQTYVSPPGYAGVEGNNSSSIPWVYAQTRVQQADANQIGIPMPIQAISFRQNNSTASATPGQMRDVTVKMATCDINTFSATFANNYLTPAVTVFARRTIVLPNWSTSPSTVPAPFSLRFALDAPFPYLGQDAILWELVVENGASGGTLPQDWVSAATTTRGATSTALGTGCTTPNGVMSLTTSFSADVQNLILSYSTTRAPANAPVVLLMGGSDPNLLVPGLCTALRSDILGSPFLGVASATGALSSAQIVVPWANAYGGLTLYGQVVSPDATQPGIGVAASNGRMSPLPLTRGGPAPANVMRTYNTGSAFASSGVTPSTTAVVTLFEY